MLKDEREAAKNIRDAEKGVKRPHTETLFVPRYNKSAIKVAILRDVDQCKGISYVWMTLQLLSSFVSVSTRSFRF